MVLFAWSLDHYFILGCLVSGVLSLGVLCSYSRWSLLLLFETSTGAGHSESSVSLGCLYLAAFLVHSVLKEMSKKNKFSDKAIHAI